MTNHHPIGRGRLKLLQLDAMFTDIPQAFDTQWENWCRGKGNREPQQLVESSQSIISTNNQKGSKLVHGILEKKSPGQHY